jgi:hypothetical protein
MRGCEVVQNANYFAISLIKALLKTKFLLALKMRTRAGRKTKLQH